MDLTTVIITILIGLVVLAKGYNMFNTIRKKGIKGVLTQKLIMLSVVGVIIGIVFLVNPDFQFENPKTIITEYIARVID